MKHIKLMFMAAALVFAGGCNDDSVKTDDNKPEITSFNFLNGNSIAAGDSLSFRVSFTDDVALSEAFVEIHPNFEGHSHGKVNTKFSDSKILELQGTQDAHIVNFEIPTNSAAGPYHIEISVLDQEGNRSDVKVLAFEITQTGQPVFTSIPTTIDASPGQSFNVSFEVQDDIDLKEVSYVLINETSNSGEIIAEQDIDFDGSDEKSFVFNQNFTAPNETATLGFVIRVLDSDENLTVGEIEIEVK